MSNNEWYEDDDIFDIEDDYEPDNAVKNLRKAERAKSKRIKELEGELESLRKFQRESVVSSVLTSKGVNPKIAALIPSDIDTDAEAIGTWLENYGDVFGITVEEAPQQVPDTTVLRQINTVTNAAQAIEDPNDVFARLNNAESAEEIINMINGF